MKLRLWKWTTSEETKERKEEKAKRKTAKESPKERQRQKERAHGRAGRRARAYGRKVAMERKERVQTKEERGRPEHAMYVARPVTMQKTAGPSAPT